MCKLQLQRNNKGYKYGFIIFSLSDKEFERAAVNQICRSINQGSVKITPLHIQGFYLFFLGGSLKNCKSIKIYIFRLFEIAFFKL